MEKLHIPKCVQHQLHLWKPCPSPSPKLIGSEPIPHRPPIWDCGSTLYDSFELHSFQRHLDSALSAGHARSLSMPHLEPPPPPPAKPNGSRISRSFKKLMRSVFFRGKSKATGGYVKEKGKEERRWFVVMEDDIVFNKDGVLSAIPEAPEAEMKAGLVSPEISAVVRKTVSERFGTRSVSMNVISSRALT